MPPIETLLCPFHVLCNFTEAVLPLRDGSKNEIPTLRSLQGQAGLEISEKNETLVKEIIIPPNDVKKGSE